MTITRYLRMSHVLILFSKFTFTEKFIKLGNFLEYQYGYKFS